MFHDRTVIREMILLVADSVSICLPNLNFIRSFVLELYLKVSKEHTDRKEHAYLLTVTFYPVFLPN